MGISWSTVLTYFPQIKLSQIHSKRLKSAPETASKRSASKSVGVRRYWLGPEHIQHCTSKKGDESMSDKNKR